VVIVRLRVRYGPAANRELEVTAIRATVGAALACVLAVAVRVTATPLTDFLQQLRVERVAERMGRRRPGHAARVRAAAPWAGAALVRAWRTAAARERR
jgi:hypothetical protein